MAICPLIPQSPLPVTGQCEVARRMPVGFLPSLKRVCPSLPQFSAELSALPRVAGCVPLPDGSIRNAPRRRFLYTWSYRGAVRQRLADSVCRLRYLDSYAPMPHCRPVEPAGQMSQTYLPSPPKTVPRQLYAMLDGSALASIAPEPAIAGLHQSLQVQSPAVVHLDAGVTPLWARLDSDTQWKAKARACGGLFLPTVAVSTLHTGFVLDAPPLESPGVHSERRGVIIPFHELAAAASHNNPKSAPVNLRRMGS